MAISAVPLLILRKCWLRSISTDKFSNSEKLLFLRCRIVRAVRSGSGVRALAFRRLPILNGFNTASILTIAMRNRRAGQGVIGLRANAERWMH